ncbi:MAG: 3-methyl-2-oxobutanoate hydroxymethyltransferase [Coriobacteriales bacterium]|nr:3-methyl-2-oxobutanoate hydroxymethyltransferase [Coriobacteriales bacterium]
MLEENPMYSPIPKMSLADRDRKSMSYLQRMKDEGKPIVQMCTAGRDPYWVMAAEMADIDIHRLAPSLISEGMAYNVENAVTNIKCNRRFAPRIHVNVYMESLSYATFDDAIRYGMQYMAAGADSLLAEGISNELCKHMADNYLVLYGHAGAISGWQTIRWGIYKRLGKTAEDALRIYKTAYEYQENGMLAMTVELTPWEVTATIAKKLRVPVLAIAACGGADGYEMVDGDIFDMMARPATHAKQYANFFKWASDAYAAWANDVRTGAYPEDKHGFHMDEAELEKFTDLVDKL